MNEKIKIILLAFLPCLFGGCAINPITGEEQFMLFTQDQDVEIGRKYAPEVEKQMGGRIENVKLQNYLNSVGQKIAQVSHNRDFEYQYVALKDKSVNAFALPGGYIFITKGMLEKLDTEAQLAGILAHETVHVVARHSSAVMSAQIGIDILLSAAISDKTPQGVATATNLGRQIISLAYSRKDERQADEAGMDYMVKAGYDPHGMIETMQMLEQENELRPIEFLSSHPSPENRMVYLTERIQLYYSNIPALNKGKEDYHKYVLEQIR